MYTVRSGSVKTVHKWHFIGFIPVFILVFLFMVWTYMQVNRSVPIKSTKQSASIDSAAFISSVYMSVCGCYLVRHSVKLTWMCGFSASTVLYKWYKEKKPHRDGSPQLLVSSTCIPRYLRVRCLWLLLCRSKEGQCMLNIFHRNLNFMSATVSCKHNLYLYMYMYYLYFILLLSLKSDT